MAILIFNKNEDGVDDFLYRISPNQSYYDTNKKWTDGLYDLVNISEDDYNKIKLNIKQVVSKNGTSVTYTENSCTYTNSGQLAKDIKSISDSIGNWLDLNTSSSLYSEVSIYLNYIKSIDVNEISYPLESTLESYVESKGISVVNPLQLL